MIDETDERTGGPRPRAEVDAPRTWLGLTLPGLLAGAGASVTAAVLGSQMGLAGTLVGAALSSVVATAAGALYTAGLQRTHDGLRVVVRRRRPVVEVLALDDPGDEVAVDPAVDRAPGGRRVLAWGGWVAAAVATFVLALTAVTGIEATTGRTLSGGSGTTVGSVAAAAEPTPAPSEPAVVSASPTPRASATPSPTASPTSAAPATATPSPTASAASSTPSTSPTAQATASTTTAAATQAAATAH